MKYPIYDAAKGGKLRILAEMQEEKALRPKREIFGVRISNDHGKSWKVIAICDKCFSQIAPPVRAAKEMESGVACDWCGAVNKK